MYTFRPPNKRRPVVILSRDDAIPLLQTVLAAPVTSTIRGLPSEVGVGSDEGLKHDSAVNLDHIYTLDKSRLERFLGTLGAEKMRSVCRALAVATGCETATSIR
jgi:mRNA interferase MazF